MFIKKLEEKLQQIEAKLDAVLKPEGSNFDSWLAILPMLALMNPAPGPSRAEFNNLVHMHHDLEKRVDLLEKSRI